MGRRIAKECIYSDRHETNACLKTAFLWDGSHLIQETNGKGSFTYIYTDTDSYEPLAQIHNWTDEERESRRQINYFHCDQIGIPREMTDKDGRLLWFGNYKGWGKLNEETNITGAHQPFRLQNQYCDEETGLHYNFFRYYEPETGRFVNQDPIGLWGGENLYGFAPNIQKWVDFLGLAISAIIHMGQQGKHIIGHNNFISGRSILTADPQRLLDDFHQGNIQGHRPISPDKEKVQFNGQIGICVDKDTGEQTPTEWGIIHSSKKGAHIVPALPDKI